VGSNPTCSTFQNFFHLVAAVPTLCSVCGTFALQIIESRKKANYVRRRKECTSCGSRVTTYELSAEHYKELEECKARLENVLRVLDTYLGKLTTDPKVTCRNCIYMKPDGECDLGFPEAGGTFAAECSSYRELV
jgi:hypothetical protein